MKKQLGLVAGLVLAASVTLAPLAFAQSPVLPTCGQALIAQSEAQRLFDTAVADDKAAAAAQKLYDDLAAARAEVAAAVKADNEAVPPLTQDSQRTKDAKAAETAALAAVRAFEQKGVTLEVLRKKAAETDAAVLQTRLDTATSTVDKACKPAVTPAPTTTPVPTPPPTVAPRIPTAINTGLSA